MGETSPKPKPTKTYRIGERMPLETPKLDIRPNAPIDNRSTFNPARKQEKFKR